MRQHRRRIARGAADIEHHVGRLDIGELRQASEHHRLHQRAAIADRQGAVDIGAAGHLLGHEDFARHRFQGIDKRRIDHAVGAQLRFDHHVACGLVIHLANSRSAGAPGPAGVITRARRTDNL